LHQWFCEFFPCLLFLVPLFLSRRDSLLLITVTVDYIKRLRRMEEKIAVFCQPPLRFARELQEVGVLPDLRPGEEGDR
jgi:hypothetical protein